jgi:hypothetical protein
MSLAMRRREAHIPHARSGGIAPVIGRSIVVLTATALRDRSDPRAGTPSFMKRSQSQMVTLVNGNFEGAASVIAGFSGPNDLAGDRLLVDLADRRGRQRRHRDELVGPGMGSHTALV